VAEAVPDNAFETERQLKREELARRQLLEEEEAKWLLRRRLEKKELEDRKIRIQPVPFRKISLNTQGDTKTTTSDAGATPAQFNEGASELQAPPQNADKKPLGDVNWVNAPNITESPAWAIERYLVIGNTLSAWMVFKTHFATRDAPAFINPATADLPLLKDETIFKKFLIGVLISFCNDAQSTIKPTTVLFRYERIGIARPYMWSKAMAYLTDQLLWGFVSKNKNKRDTQGILSELLTLWRFFFQCHKPNRDPIITISPTWESIPELPTLRGIFEHSSFGSRLQEYHPGMLSRPEVQFSAITVFNMLNKDNQAKYDVTDALRERNEVFLRLLTYTLAGADVNDAFVHTNASKEFKALPADFQSEVLNQMENAPLEAMKAVGYDGEDGKGGPTALEDFYIKRITRAASSKANVGIMEKLWEEAQFAFRTPEGENQIPPFVYNAFISGFTSLYQSSRTVEIWNHMIAHGAKPEIRTYVALLEGCVKARDLNGLIQVWNRLLRSGLTPDSHAWTTRVHGLISLRQFQAAFKAMDEMGKQWLAAENSTSMTSANKSMPTAGAINPFTKPNITVVNGAISALVQSSNKSLGVGQKVNHIQKILRWAATFECKPDVWTYNTLMGFYLGVGDHTTVFQLLRQMDKEGVKSDLATHSLLLKAAFDTDRFKDLSDQEQVDRVFAVFDDLEAGGLKLNHYLYQIAIDRLLKYYGNVHGVRLLLQHMQTRGIFIASAIYTSLFTHYFQQSPPDIAAVDSLVAQMLGPGANAHLDGITFDRLIEGYAVNGAPQQMLKLLDRMSREGKLPNWKILAMALKALVDGGAWHEAKALVNDVRCLEGIARSGVKGGAQGEQHFFYTASQLGLDSEETPPPVEARAPSSLDAGRLDGEDEFVHAAHASFLEDEPERMPQQWQEGEAAAGVR